jgi:hypothetical protein
MKTLFYVLTTLIVMGSGTGSQLVGQSIPSPYRFIETSQEGGAFLGYFSPGRGQFEFGPGPGPVLGGRYAIEVGGPFSLEGVASFFPTTRYVIEPGRVEGDRIVGEADARIVMIDGRLNFSPLGRRLWNGLGAYLLAGGGIAFDIAGDQPEDEQLLGDDRFDFGNSFTGLLGAGARWLPSDRLAFRIDGYLGLWKIDTPDGYFVADRELGSVPEDQWVSGPAVTLGAALRF